MHENIKTRNHPPLPGNEVGLASIRVSAKYIKFPLSLLIQVTVWYS